MRFQAIFFPFKEQSCYTALLKSKHYTVMQYSFLATESQSHFTTKIISVSRQCTPFYGRTSQFITRTFSCVKTHEACRPHCILPMACPAGGGGGEIGIPQLTGPWSLIPGHFSGGGRYPSSLVSGPILGEGERQLTGLWSLVAGPFPGGTPVRS